MKVGAADHARLGAEAAARFVAAALVLFSCHAAFAFNLDVEFMSTVGHGCRLTIETSDGGKAQSAVTHFQADRIDSEGRYIHGVEEGGIEGFSLAGTYTMDDDVVQNSDGTFRAVRRGDPERNILRLTKTFSLSPRGHCTFFHGVVRAHSSNTVLRHYTWGYPLGTVKEVEPPKGSGETSDPRGGKL